MSKKKFLAGLVPGTEQYVLAHAAWKKSRGRKNLSEIIHNVLHSSTFVDGILQYDYRSITNPKRSLKIAQSHFTSFNNNKEKSNDYEYSDCLILNSYIEGNSICISTDQGSIAINLLSRIPKKGDVVRFYGKGFGYTVRGIDIEGVEIRYKSIRQLDLEYRKHEIKSLLEDSKKRKMIDLNLANENLSHLPEIYQRRIKNIRRNNPDFIWENESSEVYMLKQSILLAKFIHQRTIFFGKYTSFGNVPIHFSLAYKEEIKSVYDQYKEYHDGQLSILIPGFGNNHSGNSLEFVFHMAYLFLVNPEATIYQHGWLTPICGCKNYGCHRKLSKKEKRSLIHYDS